MTNETENSAGTPDAPKQETNEEAFRGLFNREQISERVINTAIKYAEKQKEVGVQNKARKTRPWGFSSFFKTFAVFLLTQVIFSAIIIYAILPTIDLSGTTEDATVALMSNPLVLLLSALSMYLVWVGGMWVTTKYRGAKSFKKDFGVVFKKWDALIGLAFAILSFGLVLLMTWLVTDVFKLDMEGAGNAQAFTTQEGIWVLLLTFGIASIIGPFFEELFFRGYALRGILRSIDTNLELAETENKAMYGFAKFMKKTAAIWAILISSVIFGFMHFQGSETFGQWFTVIVTSVLGVLFGTLAYKFNRLGPSIFAHIFYNGGTLVVALLAGQLGA